LLEELKRLLEELERTLIFEKIPTKLESRLLYQNIQISKEDSLSAQRVSAKGREKEFVPSAKTEAAVLRKAGGVLIFEPDCDMV